MQVVRITVKNWMTKEAKRGDKAVPLRTMEGVIVAESEKAYKVVLRGAPIPSSTCSRCGRKITNPVSLLIGMGWDCGEHYGVSPVPEEQLEKFMADIRVKLSKLTFEGWIPKSQVEKIVEAEAPIMLQVVYKHEGRQYPVNVRDAARFEKIKANTQIVTVKVVDDNAVA
jgi:hypothetical protein